MLFMDQKCYIKNLADNSGITMCKDVHTPADSNSKLVKMQDDEKFVPKLSCRKLVGALTYVMTCIRPDIENALGEVAKYCERYNKSHWMASKRILKYLKTTMNYGIRFNDLNKESLSVAQMQTGRVIWIQDAHLQDISFS
uniref:Uncharacterized protein AlNc14C268G9922 n=1 Tax=Albugo laibachii Nc14 TaxID=890382 RepID=F0WUA1_9STRA|nr:hypothetical protein TcasGA2_TC002223 [Albugo laibachii Nc14]|eukprot:CCA24979.1 hypothetical protein TcasGA2_TC002223 [Albugo laibachii Nc14]